MDEATILGMHHENRKDIGQLKDDVSAIRSEQNRMAGVQDLASAAIERQTFILEGDGNGHPGLVRKVDSLIETRDQVVAVAKKVWTIAWRVIRWAVPIIALWVASWFTSPNLRNFVREYTMTAAPGIESKPKIQDAKAPYAPDQAGR